MQYCRFKWTLGFTSCTTVPRALNGTSFVGPESSKKANRSWMSSAAVEVKDSKVGWNDVERQTTEECGGRYKGKHRFGVRWCQRQRAGCPRSFSHECLSLAQLYCLVAFRRPCSASCCVVHSTNVDAAPHPTHAATQLGEWRLAAAPPPAPPAAPAPPGVDFDNIKAAPWLGYRFLVLVYFTRRLAPGNGELSTGSQWLWRKYPRTDMSRSWRLGDEENLGRTARQPASQESYHSTSLQARTWMINCVSSVRTNVLQQLEGGPGGGGYM